MAPTVGDTHLPCLGLWSAVEGKGGLNPAVDTAQGHHPLRSAADGESNEGSVGERGLVRQLFCAVVQFLPTSVFLFVVFFL